MYAIVRRYTGADGLIDTLVRRQDEVRQLIGSVAGFVSYQAIRSGDQLITVSICHDRQGAEETTRRAAEWVRQQVPVDQVRVPEVVVGDLFLEFKASATAPPEAYPASTPRPADRHPPAR